MIKNINLLVVCVFSVVIHTNQVFGMGCPLTHLDGFILSGKKLYKVGRVIAALRDGFVPLSQDDDYYCYNYSLSYQVSRPPQVAISVHDFEVEAAKNLYFYIKPIKSQSYSFIPFMIRTQWAYTSWNQISFSFIVQDRTDIESGYYQIDAGLLASCSTQKNTTILLPFRNFFSIRSQIKHLLFLNGFQITTVNKQNYRTPVEIQVINSFTNLTAINLTLTVRSQTKVDSIYISYIAIQNAMFEFQMGTYVYQTGIKGMQGQSIGQGVIAYTTSNPIGRNFARMFGINGFVINNRQKKIIYKTVWDSFTFRFQFPDNVKQIQYFSFSYIFFMGSECDNCPGYPFTFQDKCMSSCPTNTIITAQNICMFCGIGKVWNGTNCIIICPKGQYLNYQQNKCMCPPTLFWDGSNCIACTNGKFFNFTTLSCQCTKNLTWNGFLCTSISACTDGKIWDIFTFSCICQQTKYWNGSACTPFPICLGGQILNFKYECVCLQNYHWNGRNCSYSPCTGGKIWTGTQCVCPIGLYFNGRMCIQCINGQQWNRQKISCECQAGFKWNGIICEKNRSCAGNREWNQTYQQCICAAKHYWSGYRCLPVPPCSKGQYFDIISLKCICSSGQKWDGSNCISCKYGKIWNATTVTCKCPPGTIQYKQGCTYKQHCNGGKIWVNSLRLCQCPTASYWNGEFCIRNPCSNGKLWNEQYRSCECPNNNVQTNGSCLPPRISCNNGKVWNPLIYSCQCPPGTFQNFTKCDILPQCTNGKVYNPITDSCNCPYGLIQSQFQCLRPTCSPGTFYNGFKCQLIKCPPPSYLFNNQCIKGTIAQNCGFSQYWNGQRCIYYYQRCPFGTLWQKKTLSCRSFTNCSQGFYRNNNNKCQPLPQKCIPPLIWNGTLCTTPLAFSNNILNLCPNGTYLSANKCIPYISCKDSYIWDTVYLRCMCSLGSFDNGDMCIKCGTNMLWLNKIGCVCSQGYFNTGSQCLQIKQNRCQSIINAFWLNKKCLCRPGFTKIHMNCICMGTQVGTFCDRCSSKPNSNFFPQSNSCRCKEGFIQIRNECYSLNQKIIRGNDIPDNCTVSTYFSNINKICLPCSRGCLSCMDTYKCTTCRTQFIYDVLTQQCLQKCGDGKKFYFQCDDGNNNDGDGCSKDCLIENGYQCLGGSPQSRDSCFINIPQEVKLQLIGQIRRRSSITLNVKINYIPKLLLHSQQCITSCNVLDTTLTSGDTSFVSIETTFISGTEYLFTITIQFGRPYIGKLNINISINQIQSIRYFERVYTGNRLKFQVNPAYLAIVNQYYLQ